MTVRNQKGADYEMLDNYGDVLKISDLQDILWIGRNAVYKLLQNQEIPAFRIGTRWRVSKAALLAYLGRWKTQKPV